MTALKKTQPTRRPAAPKSKPEVRAVIDGIGIEPVESPAHKLQKALQDAGYQSDTFTARPLSNGMLVLSLICVYALSMLMFFGSMSV